MTHPGWYERSRRSLLARLPDRVAPGSEAWRWARLCVRAMGEVLGVFLAVVATGLLGIGIGLALHGFDVATLSVSAPRSEALAVGVSTLMLGTVVLGVAVEGRLRGIRVNEGTRSWEVPVA